MQKKRNSNLQYECIPYHEIEKILNLFKRRFDEFLLLKGFPLETEKYVLFYSLIDVIIRVDKRKAYYHCFHNMEINECKEVALYAYWIIKLRPFIITDEKFKNNFDACIINESFAIYLIGLVLEETGRIKLTKNMNSSYCKFLEYSFRFRNFSIDSFVVLVESITTETLEKSYPDFLNQSQ